MKVVSLLPAATEIVCSLGLRARLVARSHECDFPAGVETLPALTRARVDSSLPSTEIDEQVRRIIGSRLPIDTLDEARLAALAPDVVVTQAACGVCAISYPSPYSTWDELTALEPDAVIVAPCGFDLERTRRESGPFADRLRALAPRVLLLDGNAYLNRPGPRVVEAVESIAAWLGGAFVAKERAADLGAALPT